MNGVAMASATTGWAVGGNGTILSTTDGGNLPTATAIATATISPSATSTVTATAVAGSFWRVFIPAVLRNFSG